jgi:hypothetical protein
MPASISTNLATNPERGGAPARASPAVKKSTDRVGSVSTMPPSRLRCVVPREDSTDPAIRKSAVFTMMWWIM